MVVVIKPMMSEDSSVPDGRHPLVGVARDLRPRWMVLLDGVEHVGDGVGRGRHGWRVQVAGCAGWLGSAGVVIARAFSENWL